MIACLMMVRMTDPAKLRFSFSRALLSLFIVFHLLVILVLANGSSYLGRNLQSLILPYGNVLGLNATWNFFSPDPAHTMYYKYKVYFENAEGDELSPVVEGFLPPEKSHIVIDSSKRRLLYSMRFLTIEPSRIKTLMGPWLCKSHPGATRVRIDYVMEQIPFLDVAVARRNEPMEELISERNLIRNDISCTAAQDEVL
jgi:hypothetical protein